MNSLLACIQHLKQDVRFQYKVRYFMPPNSVAPLAFYFTGDLLSDYTNLELISTLSPFFGNIHQLMNSLLACIQHLKQDVRFQYGDTSCRQIALRR
jgi:hypothetical protein